MLELDEGDTIESHNRKPGIAEIKQRIQELNERKEKYEGYKKQLKESGESEISTIDPDARLM